jgi:hypothetical protein
MDIIRKWYGAWSKREPISYGASSYKAMKYDYENKLLSIDFD